MKIVLNLVVSSLILASFGLAMAADDCQTSGTSVSCKHYFKDGLTFETKAYTGYSNVSCWVPQPDNAIQKGSLTLTFSGSPADIVWNNTTATTTVMWKGLKESNKAQVSILGSSDLSFSGPSPYVECSFGPNG